MKLEVIDVLGNLPHFNPDISVESVPEVERYVGQVRSCDGIVVSSPVYAGGYPGTLKNALDWLVGTDAFIEKPFAFMSASNRVPAVQESLRVVIETMGGVHVSGASTLIPILGQRISTQDLVEHDGYGERIRSSLDAYATYLS
jgi:chromate reductase